MAPRTPVLPGLLTIREVARALGVSRRRAHRIVASGALAPAMETPLGRLFEPEDVAALAADRRARAEAGDRRIVT
jgi:hypothetical protein